MLYTHVKTDFTFIGVRGKVYKTGIIYPVLNSEVKKKQIRDTALLICKCPQLFSSLGVTVVVHNLRCTGNFLHLTDEQQSEIDGKIKMEAKIEHTKADIEIPKEEFDGTLLDSLKAGDIFRLENSSHIYQVMSGGSHEFWKDGQRLVSNLISHSVIFMPRTRRINKLYKSITIKVE